MKSNGFDRIKETLLQGFFSQTAGCELREARNWLSFNGHGEVGELGRTVRFTEARVTHASSAMAFGCSKAFL